MYITQTVEVPANHRLTIDVPREIPAGAVILTFTPAESDADKAEAEYRRRKAREWRDAEIINRNAERLNRDMEEVLLDQGDLADA